MHPNMDAKRLKQFYINGQWVDPVTPRTIDVIDPATELVCAVISNGSAADVDKAMKAARAAFASYSLWTVKQRAELLKAIIAEYKKRWNDLAEAITSEMGAPMKLSTENQVGSGAGHLRATLKALESFSFEEQRGGTRIIKEPIGVAALITPWNWPLNQIACKVAPALAAGCTMVLKPSEVAPLSGMIFAEILHDAGVPAGVFNLVNGDGPSVGAVMAAHPEADMVSFTGSTRAGVAVAKAAADTVKRVAQELGGKSPNIIMPDADLEEAVTRGVKGVFSNSGQSCNAPTRMLVPADKESEALRIAKRVAEATVVGDPRKPGVDIGPVVSAVQFDKIQRLIQSGIDEGATLVAGGTGRPDGLNGGYFVKPTVFGHVKRHMTIAREEIFGPVLSIMSYKDIDEAVDIANDTVYGLAAYIQTSDVKAGMALARRLRAGQVEINDQPWDLFAPFGGYKQSGNGREYADWGLHDFLEIKAVIGWAAE